jgi:hypothetical protein
VEPPLSLSVASDVKPFGVAATSEESGEPADVEDVVALDGGVEVEGFGGCDPLAEALQAERVRTVRVIPIFRPKDPLPA